MTGNKIAEKKVSFSFTELLLSTASEEDF